MRRWLLIFLLFLFPFQFSWASASAYCQHERDTQSQHWGHHAHEVRDTDRSHSGEGAQKNSSTPPNAVLGDCAACHSGGAQHVDAAAQGVPDMPLARQTLRTPTTEHFVSHICDVPVRPAWSLAA